MEVQLESKYTAGERYWLLQSQGLESNLIEVKHSTKEVRDLVLLEDTLMPDNIKGYQVRFCARCGETTSRAYGSKKAAIDHATEFLARQYKIKLIVDKNEKI